MEKAGDRIRGRFPGLTDGEILEELDRRLAEAHKGAGVMTSAIQFVLRRTGPIIERHQFGDDDDDDWTDEEVEELLSVELLEDIQYHLQNALTGTFVGDQT